MAGGWSRDGAVQDQIDQSVADAVEHARLALAGGVSRPDCEDCGEPIPEARRQAVPGVRRCVACQEQHDADARFQSTFNRRGSKDSQLR
ncbi:MAG: DksA/TraR family C4-type zinc finger protein [Proteobacteria bacterium]|jgi:phage/conjugal plasmid C-4 type zinc finger TraR family protein|nr:DksA/TraR family C4-type zinc finger protein [Pseudomonadota bacterium]